MIDSSAARAASPALARVPASPGPGGSGASMPARRISRPSSRVKLRPSVMARTFPVPPVSDRHEVDGRLSAPTGSVGSTTMAAIQETQQKLARMPCRRPSMRQRNVGIGRYCGDADVRARFLAMGRSGMQYLQGTGQSPIHPDGSEATVRVGYFTRALLARCATRVGLGAVAAALLVASATVAAQDARK